MHWKNDVSSAADKMIDLKSLYNVNSHITTLNTTSLVTATYVAVHKPLQLLFSTLYNFNLMPCCHITW